MDVIDMTEHTISGQLDEVANQSMISKTYIWWLIFKGRRYDRDSEELEHHCPYCQHKGPNYGLMVHMCNMHPWEKRVVKLDQIFQRLQGMRIEFKRFRRKDIDDAIEYLSKRFDEKGTLEDV